MPQHTSTRVFDTPELLELILLHLELLNILRLQRVNHRFRDSISSSPLLKRLTLKAQPRTLSGDLPSFIDDTFCGRSSLVVIREHEGRLDSRQHLGSSYFDPFVEHEADSAGVPHIDGRLFNPWLDRVFTGLRVQHLEYGWTLITATALPPISLARDKASWHKMLLVALPLKELRIEPAVRLVHRSPPWNPADEERGIPASPRTGWIDPPNREAERRVAALHNRMVNSLASTISPSSTSALLGHTEVRGSHPGPQHRHHHRPVEIDRRRYGNAGTCAPVGLSRGAAFRNAAARGEASNEGWVWGAALQLVEGGERPFPGYARSLTRAEGVTVGMLVDEMRGSKWLSWVVRRTSRETGPT